jgi:adenylate cyclase class 2
MLEIEVKARCSSHDKMKDLLLSKGASFSGSVKEKDDYFNHPFRDFKKTQEAFRLRVQNGKCFITYKGPKLGGVAKSRFEAETAIGDYATMRSILENLGFCYVGSVEKKRDSYELNGITVCLDDVPALGLFIEIEKIGEDRDSVEKDVLAAAVELGVSEFERRSYLSLVLEKKSL